MAVLPPITTSEISPISKIVSAALKAAREPGRMVVLGIAPTRPETGFGYIERMEATIGPRKSPSIRFGGSQKSPL
jgi:mannose-1-phosphate guanylyltransferase